MLSRRCQQKSQWFLDAFGRNLKRQASIDPSSIDLATAENWLIRPALLPLLQENGQQELQKDKLSYPHGSGGTPQLLDAVASYFNQFFNPRVPVQPEHVVTGSGCNGVMDSLINDICDEGEALLVQAPYWTGFEANAVLRNSVKLVHVHISFQDSSSPSAVVAAYRNAAEAHAAKHRDASKIRGILFCNPHNPYGHIYAPEVIDALLQYSEETNIHFVSDEIYALSTYGPPMSEGDAQMMMNGKGKGKGKMLPSPTKEFVSVLARDLEALGVNSSRVHVLYSISKDLGCSGIRLGCLITQSNPQLRMSQAILNSIKISAAATAIIAPVLSDKEQIQSLMDLNVKLLRRAASIAVRFAEFHGLTYYQPVAGLYIWLRLATDCKDDEEEESIVKLCARKGVLVGGGADYFEKEPGWFRITTSVLEDQFLEGLKRLEDAMEYKERFRMENVN